MENKNIPDMQAWCFDLRSYEKKFQICKRNLVIDLCALVMDITIMWIISLGRLKIPQTHIQQQNKNVGLQLHHFSV